jgi:hypothetical protein
MTVGGRPEDVRKFADATLVRHQDDSVESFSLNHLFPCPQELTDTVSGWSGDPEVQAEYERKWAENKDKYGYKDWYDWANANYGTKWGACDVELENDWQENCDEVRYHYQSAWSPATGLIANISAQFPTLVFATWFEEEGVAYMGGEVFHQGELVYEESIDYEDMDLPDYDWDDIEKYEAYNGAKLNILDAIADRCEEAVSNIFAELVR